MFFTSIPLVTELLALKTTYIGTFRKNKAEIPLVFLPAKIREVYSTLFGHTEKITFFICPKIKLLYVSYQQCQMIGALLRKKTRNPK